LEKKETKRKAQEDELRAAEASLKTLYKTLAEKQEKLNRSPYPAHKILADRIAKRDPGNAPASGERIGFVYIAPPPGQLAPKLQGDRIETPDFIREKGLQPDYKYYIEHQLEKPLGQLFGLVVDQLPGYALRVKRNVALTDGEQEALAIELLFQKALSECDKVSRRAFGNRFGLTTAETSTRVLPSVEQNFGGNILVIPTAAPVRKAAAPSGPMVQTSMSRYLLHKTIVQQFDEAKSNAKANLEKKDKEEKKKKK